MRDLGVPGGPMVDFWGGPGDSMGDFWGVLWVPRGIWGSYGGCEGVLGVL